jgi:hypothetical protein
MLYHVIHITGVVEFRHWDSYLHITQSDLTLLGVAMLSETVAGRVQ